MAMRDETALDDSDASRCQDRATSVNGILVHSQCEIIALRKELDLQILGFIDLRSPSQVIIR